MQFVSKHENSLSLENKISFKTENLDIIKTNKYLFLLYVIWNRSEANLTGGRLPGASVAKDPVIA